MSFRLSDIEHFWSCEFFSVFLSLEISKLVKVIDTIYEETYKHKNDCNQSLM